MKRVLIIAYYFPPLGLAGVNRPLHLFKYLPAYGWEPHILTVGPVAYAAYEPELLTGLDASRIHRSKDYWPRRALAPFARIAPFGKLRESVRHDTRSRSLFSLLNSGTTIESFPDALYQWAPHAITTGRAILEKIDFDLLCSTSPPVTTHLVGQQLHRESGIPWVADFRDFWGPDRIEQQFRSIKNVTRAKELLSDISGSAAAITTINSSIAETLSDASIIPNGFDPELAILWQPPPDSSGTFQLGLLGNMTPLSWDPIVRLVSELKSFRPESAKKLKIVHVGDDYNQRGQAAFQAAGLQAMLISCGRCSRTKSIEILNSTNALFIGFDSEKGDHLLPTRLFDLLAGGRPLLAASGPRSELRTFVQSLSFVHWYDVNEPLEGAKELARMIQELLDSGELIRGFEARQTESAPFSARVMASRFATRFDSISRK